MLYLSDDIRIPNSFGLEAGAWPEPLVLELRSNIDLDAVTVELADVTVGALYFEAAGVELPALTPGEYTYRLRRGADGPVVSEGVAVAGGHDVTRTTYDKSVNYAQYE